jgi:hypothetical protein
LGRKTRYNYRGKSIARSEEQKGLDLSSNRNFKSFSSTRQKFGFRFMNLKMKKEYIGGLKRDEELLKLMGVEDMSDKPHIYNHLIYNNLTLYDFLRYCLDGLITYDFYMQKFIHEHMRKEDQRFPENWEKICEKILEKEETIQKILNPMYLEREGTFNNFYDFYREVTNTTEEFNDE